MSEHKKRGAFIVLEGLDRSGKSTQAALLADRLKQEGVDVKLIKFPGLYAHHLPLYSQIVIRSQNRPHDPDRQDDRLLPPLAIRP